MLEKQINLTFSDLLTDLSAGVNGKLMDFKYLETAGKIIAFLDSNYV